MISFPHLRLLGIVASGLIAATTSSLVAQTSTPDVTARYPSKGIAIIDCKPAKPAPENSCTLRVPPSQLRGELRSFAVGDEKGSFEFVRPDDDLFPKNINLSTTLILIDTTPGPGGQRRRTFNVEKELLKSFVESLPEGESVAIYGFNENLERKVDFTTIRSRVVDAIDSFQLSGTNTRITTHTKDAIKILAQQKKVLFRNLVIVSDGDEEGIRATKEVRDAAVSADIAVTALGMFWRAIGATETGKGMDYLRALSGGDAGAALQIQLRRAAQSRTDMAAYIEGYNSAHESSGLIVPRGTPRASDIVVTMKEPVIGAAKSFKDRDVRVRFSPVNDGATNGVKTNTSDSGDMLFGYPAWWVYIAGGILAALLLLLILLALLRRSSDDELDDANNEILPFAEVTPNDQDDKSTRLAPRKSAPARPQAAPAYLVLSGTKEKLPVMGQRAPIGRSTSNAVVIDDDSISRVHAELHRNRDGGYSITDMDSLNGTFVNNAKVAGTQAIRAGDEIRFGEVSTKLVLA